MICTKYYYYESTWHYVIYVKVPKFQETVCAKWKARVCWKSEKLLIRESIWLSSQHSTTWPVYFLRIRTINLINDQIERWLRTMETEIWQVIWSSKEIIIQIDIAIFKKLKPYYFSVSISTNLFSKRFKESADRIFRAFESKSKHTQ